MEPETKREVLVSTGKSRMMFSRVFELLWLLFGNLQVAEVWDSSTLYPWEDQYPFGLNRCPLREYRLKSCGGFVSNGVVLLDARCQFPAVVDCCPDFLTRAFSACSVARFLESSVTWLESSEIVFMRSTSDILSACVAVARFAIAWV